MKPIIIFSILVFCFSNLYAQKGCNIIWFKKLTSISSKDSITDQEFDKAIQILKKLEHSNCSDYIGSKNGEDYVIAGRTFLFGEICLKKNNHKAIDEYLSYMKRHHGSTEEEISFSFERLFIKQPEYILLVIGYNQDLLNRLEWGFMNNHWQSHLNKENYKKIFYQINPKIKAVYPKYKRQIDYLLDTVSEELKG